MKTCARIGTWPITSIRFPDRKGDSTRVAVCSWDITERKHAEEELRRHRDHLDERVKDKTAELTIANEQLQEKINLLLQAEKSICATASRTFARWLSCLRTVSVSSSDGIVVFINSAGVKILGAESPEQIIGKQVTELVHPDYRETVSERMSKVTSYGNISSYVELQLVRLDGSIVDVELGSTPCVYQNKQVAQAVFRDISKRKMIEKALIESEDKFRMLAETTASAIIIIRAPTSSMQTRLLKSSAATHLKSCRELISGILYTLTIASRQKIGA